MRLFRLIPTTRTRHKTLNELNLHNYSAWVSWKRFALVIADGSSGLHTGNHGLHLITTSITADDHLFFIDQELPL